MFPVFVLIFLISNTTGQPCDDDLSVDLSKASRDSPIVFNGITFPPKYVYDKNVSGVVKTFGCPCAIGNCFRKCCEFGSVYNATLNRCEGHTGLDLLLNRGLSLSLRNIFRRNAGHEETGFSYLFGIPCGGNAFLEDDNEWFIQEDGKLYVELPSNIPPWTLLAADKFCVDTFVYEKEDGTREEKLDALICFLETKGDYTNYLLSSVCMFISCVFIVATVAVYAWLPELRNLHGRVLMAYLLCLFVGFGFLASMQTMLLVNDISPPVCVGMTFVIYFFLLAAFFWLNVMCFDIWWTFSGKRGLALEKLSIRARFFAYAMYAFGVPSALTVTLAILEFAPIPPHGLLPNIKRHGCFLFGMSKLFYLYGPIVILCVANMVFFILTARKIAQIKQETSVLKSKESAMHDQHRNDKQRLLLYVKLFIVMGVNWLLEVISAIYPEPAEVWRYTDAYNVLIGLIIFVIFVCKRKIFRLMKKRIKDRFQQREMALGDLRQFRKRGRMNWKNCQNQRASLDTIRTYLGTDTDSGKAVITTQC